MKRYTIIHDCSSECKYFCKAMIYYVSTYHGVADKYCAALLNSTGGFKRIPDEYGGMSKGFPEFCPLKELKND